MTDEKREHIWISNSAFKKLTGISKVCMTCKQTRPGESTRYCPGPPRPKANPTGMEMA